MGDGPDRGQRPPGRREDTDDPRWARQRALKILFQADVRQVSPEVTLQRLRDDAQARALLDEVDDLADGSPLLPPIAHEPGVEVEQVIEPAQVPDRGAPSPAAAASERGRPAQLDGFTRRLVLGVHEHRDEVDALISRFARRWQISRMPVVDRTVLRLATYELLHEPTAPAVTISEAVRLAREMSTDDSGRYVNGVLESIRRHLAGNARA